MAPPPPAVSPPAPQTYQPAGSYSPSPVQQPVSASPAPPAPAAPAQPQHGAVRFSSVFGTRRR